MKPLHRVRALSISAHSFLLVLAALLVSALIALFLVVRHPPLRNAPVALEDIAALLGAAPPAPGGGPRPGPPRPPPQDWRPAPAGGPPPREARRPSPRNELRIETRDAAPATPRQVDAAASAAAAAALAVLIGVPADAVVVQVPPAAVLPGGRGGAPDARSQLGEGFVAARRLEDGRWRTVISVVEGFPNAFQRQALMLAAIGLALLLPLAWLFARALTAPLRHFAEGAQRLGRDPGAPPLPSTGPREMRAAVDAFNTMQSRVNRLLEERTQMIGAIAHDLRTPLTRMAFRLEGLPPPLGEKVEADIQEMKAMISTALDYLRDRSVGGARERLDLRLLLERIVDDLADLGHDVTLAPGPAVTLEGAPLALRRMLMNLVENALKYGQRARIALGTSQATATIEIDDDGPGIPENRQQQVFDPFYRLEASRNRDTGGIGLGLSTVRAIVLDHGGEITLGNRSGGGLRVTVRLPLPA